MPPRRSCSTAESAAWDFVGRKAWDPDWEQVFVFLAGKLAASPDLERHLLNLLSDEANDDAFRHRLGVAALCLDEIPRGAQPAVTEQIDRITEEAFSPWWEQPGRTVDVFPHLARGFPGLAKANGRFRGAPLLDWLAARLRDADSNARRGAALAFAEIGSLAGTRDIMERLLGLLDDREAGDRAYHALQKITDAKAGPDFLEWLANQMCDARPSLRRWTAGAIAQVGKAATTPVILARIAELLRDDDPDVRRWACEAVGGMGREAGTPVILERMLDLLRDEDSDVRYSAAVAVGGLGAAAANDSFLAGLAELVHDETPEIRHNAVAAIAWIGAAAIPIFLDWIADLLRDSDPEVRCSIANAMTMSDPVCPTPPIIEGLERMLLGEMHSPSLKEEQLVAAWALRRSGRAPASRVISALIGQLRNNEPQLRVSAVDALTMVRAAAMPSILERFTELVRDDDVRTSALRAIQEIGDDAATPEFLTRIVELLNNRVASVRSSAAEVVARMGAAAATDEILERLAQLLRDGDRGVRESAANAVFRMNAAAATPAILDWIAEALQHWQTDISDYAIGAVRDMGPVAATPAILTCIAEVLRDRDSQYLPVSWAATAVGAMGKAAATPAILEGIAGLLRHDNWVVDDGALEGVGGMGAAAAVPPIIAEVCRLLFADDILVRDAAAKTLNRIMADGVRFFKASDGTLEPRLIQELSAWNPSGAGTS